MYRLTKSMGQTVIILETDEVRSSFVEDLDNTDYQDFLAWVEAGNTPEPWMPDA